VALLPGSIDVKVWVRKSDEGDPEPVVTKDEGRKPFGSEGNNELPGAPVQGAAYSDKEVEKGWWTEGGGDAEEWESEVVLLSGEGLPSIAVRMEYSRLAASEPKVKHGVLRGVLDKGSFGMKSFMTAGTLGAGDWT
jgi:hypothetical protein